MTVASTQDSRSPEKLQITLGTDCGLAPEGALLRREPCSGTTADPGLARAS